MIAPGSYHVSGVHHCVIRQQNFFTTFAEEEPLNAEIVVSERKEGRW
jgi:hypothetical protein